MLQLQIEHCHRDEIEKLSDALEETAANMSQMTESVQKNAQNARTANQMVLETRQLANDSKSVLEKAILLELVVMLALTWL